ncbi:erythromycin esterase family protein [Planosporangium sp. 12N6]|uniref:erythromycin esterase family protein n=1 Tax=Planosporangium spinosum TaxID=3402278 RepID=UPI003CF54BB6
MGRYSEDTRRLAAPLSDADDTDPVLARVGDARIVMLGEASHGTHEFYEWRALLTRRLIEEHGFSFVGVEGDWPDCERVDRSVRCREGAADDPREALEQFDRWPTWMWANEEVVDFCRWLRTRNANLAPHRRVGFHGLDVYSLWESMEEIILHLREHDPERVEAAMNAYRCFEPFGEDPQSYALATRFTPHSCEDDVVKLLRAARQRAVESDSGEFALWQNAEVVAGAERYYRAMVTGGANSWNIRDQHMMDTLDRLLAHYGPQSKAVVWAHNTHVGDARATDMTRAGMFNIGQLARERHGRDRVVLIGFGAHRGTVIAAREWGAPMEIMTVPPARPGSLEDALHTDAPAKAHLVFPRTPGGGRPRLLTDWLDHRAIGVVYRPERESWGNYVPTKLGDRYDAFLWFDRTRSVRPLHVRHVDLREPETYPVGV